MDKQALAAFLRGRRERVSPRDAGLPAGSRRRTPGLRREEVAQLAMISVDHYTRLEQGRGRHPSRTVLNGIARALRLDGQEQEHLFRLAGQAESGSGDGPAEDVPAGTLQLLDRISDAGVVVISGACKVLAWNPLAAALFEDFSALGADDRNLVRRYFLHPDPSRRGYGMGASPQFARAAVSYLRVAATRYPHNDEVRDLIRDLLAASTEFARLWREQELHIDHHSHQVIDHPAVGRLELDFEILTLPDRDQQLVLFTAEPGSPVHRALELLRVIGTQDFSASR
ncbi:transcriptional regulator [Paractinoplanes abujensis]|uniref:Transcriptional regulator with XRE-family HTH domain n=1 Tax=Paractinoplanes abujensis TaxID=882441 RepID=A0A7W7CUG2_9ACTN|nr:helix-turn-helix transcriptional regulator [Actinoplanes abujensis]MBB4693201.1 transcriptional regulator with XRE-family HTH domain [Actinoplanes abujensis]GID24400.1 transcriptional regulator [Actinoplanes abujensis]